MEKLKNIKILIGLFYLFLLFLFLYIFFSKFDLNELSSYNFLKSNRDLLISAKEENLLFVSLIFIAFTILWVLFLGFGSPIGLIGGFIFGKWLGTFLVAGSLTIGATLLYVFGNFYLKNFIRENFLYRFENLRAKFEKNEFIFLLAFRFIGGVPFAIANLLPVLFNINIRNYFMATLLGIMPSIFIIVSLGDGIEEIIKNNESLPSMMQLFLNPEIYMPICGFIILVIITVICKNLFIKK